MFLNAIQKNGRRGISLIFSISPKLFIKSRDLAKKSGNPPNSLLQTGFISIDFVGLLLSYCSGGRGQVGVDSLPQPVPGGSLAFSFCVFYVKPFIALNK